jgi:hypothetical protein
LTHLAAASNVFVQVKEHLKGVERRKQELDLRIDANKAALQYLKRRGFKVRTCGEWLCCLAIVLVWWLALLLTCSVLQVDRIDHMISAIDNAQGLWHETLKQAPITSNTIVPNNKVRSP